MEKLKKIMETKKYFIGCTFNEVMSEFLSLSTEMLSERFGIPNTCKKYPPHLTNKIPFIATDEQIASVKDFLRTYVLGIKNFELTMWGFNHFSNHTVYIDIAPNQKLLPYIIFQRNLYNSLYEKFASWMTFGGYEPLELPHVTIAQNAIELKIVEMLELLNSQDSFIKISNKPLIIENLTLFEKTESGIWNVGNHFPIH